MEGPKKTRIVIIDDDEFLLKILNIRFSAKGFELIPFKSAEEALAKLPNFKPQFKPNYIILDVFLAGMNGIDAGKKIRMIPGFEETPFIFLSASDREEDKEEAYKMGAISYIVKPFDPDSLEEIILEKKC